MKRSENLVTWNVSVHYISAGKRRNMKPEYRDLKANIECAIHSKQKSLNHDTTIEYYGTYTSLSIAEMISLKGSTVAKNCSNKSCWELNSVQKTQKAHMFISLRSGARGLQRLICFKYFIVLKWESRLTLVFDAAKITDYIKECFK